MARRPDTMATATRRWNTGKAAHLCCTFAFFCVAPNTLAQYRFDSYTTDNGLPQNSIWAMCQTRDGYIWLATGEGLLRFDGVRFQVFNSTNTPARSGRLWRRTHDRALSAGPGDSLYGAEFHQAGRHAIRV
jgi:ligand-binding sensor domain-containing protein